MGKMKFQTRVKYKDAFYNGLVPFDVDEDDIKALQEQGGVLLVDSTEKPERPTPEPDRTPKKTKRKDTAGEE